MIHVLRFRPVVILRIDFVFTKMSAFWILHVASGSLASTMLLAAALRRHAGTLAPFFTATALSP